MKNCDFLFKGNRKYIHGTDLYRYLKKFFPIKFNYIDIKFHKQIKFQPKILQEIQHQVFFLQWSL